MGWKKKQERALFKNRISAATERRREIEAAKKETGSWREGGRVYVLYCMVVTFPTCQAERSPLKATARSNTAHSNKKKRPTLKMGWKKKEERALFKNRISAATERRKEI
jgi:hypothetical protein